jgi:hypothetical protein
LPWLRRTTIRRKIVDEATRDGVVRVIGNCFFEAHPFREGAAGLAELSRAKPLFARLPEADLVRFALPLLDLLLERLKPCAACHATLADVAASLCAGRPDLASRCGDRLAGRVRADGPRAGDHCPATRGLGRMPGYEIVPPGQQEEARVEFHAMTVAGRGWHVVAKVGRLSSPPLPLGRVADLRAVALRRLADLLRCGGWSRNYADYVGFTRMQEEEPGPGWEGYERAVGRELGADALGHFEPLALATPVVPQPGLRVTYHDAEMNSRPYCVARVGTILGPPTALLLLPPEEVRPSALDRLADVFRVGNRGQCFADFVAGFREAGRDGEAIQTEWERYQAAVQSDLAR